MRINQKMQRRVIVFVTAFVIAGIVFANPYTSQPLLVSAITALVLGLFGIVVSAVYNRLLRHLPSQRESAARLDAVVAGLGVYLLAMHALGQLTVLDAVLAVLLALSIAGYLLRRRHRKLPVEVR